MINISEDNKKSLRQSMETEYLSTGSYPPPNNKKEDDYNSLATLFLFKLSSFYCSGRVIGHLVT